MKNPASMKYRQINRGMSKNGENPCPPPIPIMNINARKFVIKVMRIAVERGISLIAFLRKTDCVPQAMAQRMERRMLESMVDFDRPDF